jgi:hypothetical protein
LVCLQRYAKCPIELQNGGHTEIVLAEQEDKDTQRQILQVQAYATLAAQDGCPPRAARRAGKP